MTTTMIKTAALVAALLVASVSAAGDPGVFNDENGDEVTYCPKSNMESWAYGGKFEMCEFPITNAGRDPSNRRQYNKLTGQRVVAPLIGFEYDSWSANEAEGTGFRWGVDYIAEVGASDRTAVRKIFGNPHCNNTDGGDYEHLYEDNNNMPWGCGQARWPWGDNSHKNDQRDCFEDDWMQFIGSANNQVNISMCGEPDKWTEFGQSFTTFQSWDDPWENNDDRSTASARAQSTARQVDEEDNWRLEFGRGEMWNAIYDWPFSSDTNRLHFRYVFERVNMDGPDAVNDCFGNDWADDCLLFRGAPRGDGFECRFEGPPVPGRDKEECESAADPQIRVNVQIHEDPGSAIQEISTWSLQHLYGHPGRRNTQWNNWDNTGFNFYDSEACGCTKHAQAPEVNFEAHPEDPNVWFLNIVLSQKPDSSECTGNCGGFARDDPRGIFLRAFQVQVDAAGSVVASAALVVVAAVAALAVAAF